MLHGAGAWQLAPRLVQVQFMHEQCRKVQRHEVHRGLMTADDGTDCV